MGRGSPVVPPLVPIFQSPAAKFELLVTPTLMTRSGIDFLAGVALISATLLMTELALTRIFSVVMYYHFAFLASSSARS